MNMKSENESIIGLTPWSRIEAMCMARDLALAEFERGMEHFLKAAESARLSAGMYVGCFGLIAVGGKEEDLAGPEISSKKQAAEAVRAFRRRLDRKYWDAVYEALALARILDDHSACDWSRETLEKRPAFTLTNIRRRLRGVRIDPAAFFRAGLVHTCAGLRNIMRLNLPFTMPGRFRVRYGRRKDGAWSHVFRRQIVDLEIACHILRYGRPPANGKSRVAAGLESGAAEFETEFFRVKSYAGAESAHVQICDPEMIAAINHEIAACFGQVSADPGSRR